MVFIYTKSDQIDQGVDQGTLIYMPIIASIIGHFPCEKCRLSLRETATSKARNGSNLRKVNKPGDSNWSNISYRWK